MHDNIKNMNWRLNTVLGKNLGTLLFPCIKDATKIEMSQFVAKKQN